MAGPCQFLHVHYVTADLCGGIMQALTRVPAPRLTYPAGIRLVLTQMRRVFEPWRPGPAVQLTTDVGPGTSGTATSCSAT